MKERFSDFAYRLNRVDLGSVRFSLTLQPNGPRWNSLQVSAVEKWYRRYHVLFEFFPNHPIVPTAEIDEFWHYHILDTHKYFTDCMDLHGRFIHHFPFLGARGHDDERVLKLAFHSTLELCRVQFGVSPEELSVLFPTAVSDGGVGVVCGGGCANDLSFSERPSTGVSSNV